MCGRFTLAQPTAVLARLFDLEEPPGGLARYNIAPSQPVLAVRVGQERQREWAWFQWGLVPSWAQDPTVGARLINARSETVAEKPAFRAAFRARRCLIPADGFYEWRKSNGRRQPYYICLREGSPFAFAGLWEHWEGPEGSVLESCTILTTQPNELIRPLHDRMPVILPPEAYERWLDPDWRKPEGLLSLLRPYPAEAMIAYPVRFLVNNPKNEGAELIKPIVSGAEELSR